MLLFLLSSFRGTLSLSEAKVEMVVGMWNNERYGRLGDSELGLWLS